MFLVQSLLALSFFCIFFSLDGSSVSALVASKKVVSQVAEPLVLRLRHITFHLLSQPPLKVCHVVNTFPLMTQWERIYYANRSAVSPKRLPATFHRSRGILKPP